jgi:ribosomal protein S18 acetylase RimI-like enzyme
MSIVLTEKVKMGAIAPETLKQWAELYCKIWQEPPWNEDFWRPEEVIKDFQTEMRNPDATAFLAFVGDKVVGFTHGYSVNKVELQGIASNNMLDSVFCNGERVYYVDELGVDKDYRGHQIGHTLTAKLIDSARASGIKRVVLRTDIQASAARRVYQRMAFKDLKINDANYLSRTYWLLELG